MSGCRSLATAWRGLVRARGGGAATTLGLTLPVILGCAGAAINYGIIANDRSMLQGVADAAATSAARELTFARADAAFVEAVATGYAQSLLAGRTGVEVTARVGQDLGSVQVDITARSHMPLPIPMVGSDYSVGVSAVARATAGPPICVIALDEAAEGTILMDNESRLTGDGCAVYSNSRSDRGITGKKTSVLKAELICSAGGFLGASTNFVPNVLSDCPPLPDPLTDRAPPAERPCKATALTIDKGSSTLSPGTYCGGLTITGGAIVKLTPGIYVIKDGPLKVENGSLSGQNVSLHFKGREAVVRFMARSTIDLTAPKDGPLAGFLIFEDRSVRELQEHRILSENARNLLGTIYLPRGRLLVDAPQKVADLSAYTIIVAKRLELRSGPNLVLNTGYSSTDIPVPHGVGPIGGTVSLAR
ncbi:TadE/TadG family type IV pilus assembly protein [Prosthecomicrobium sp. N25]|uniref:TadE/TadG family type IV pilus assembly protein n=1 Tax=Prosthecomicrobium sp. N25 TaxID=3129254 RepID=UPI0030773A1B